MCPPPQEWAAAPAGAKRFAHSLAANFLDRVKLDDGRYSEALGGLALYADWLERRRWASSVSVGRALAVDLAVAGRRRGRVPRANHGSTLGRGGGGCHSCPQHSCCPYAIRQSACRCLQWTLEPHLTQSHFSPESLLSSAAHTFRTCVASPTSLQVSRFTSAPAGLPHHCPFSPIPAPTVEPTPLSRPWSPPDCQFFGQNCLCMALGILPDPPTPTPPGSTSAARWAAEHCCPSGRTSRSSSGCCRRSPRTTPTPPGRPRPCWAARTSTCCTLWPGPGGEDHRHGVVVLRGAGVVERSSARPVVPELWVRVVTLLLSQHQ